MNPESTDQLMLAALQDITDSGTSFKDGYQIPTKEPTTDAMTCTSSTIVSACDDDDMLPDDDEFETAQGKKRRKTDPRCHASSLKDEGNLQVGSTVLFIPTENHKVESLSKLKLTDYLNNVAPGMVSVVRINKARNIVAVDVKRPLFKAELLKLSKLCAVPVRAFLPRDRSNCFGILRDIDPDCTEDDIKTHLQSSVGVAEVKRLGKTSPVVRVAFTGKVAPQHVKVGLVRTEVIPYRARPLQCYRCYKFGHIAAACTAEFQLCYRCGLRHEGTCEANPNCVNCQGQHASNSAECPVKVRETEVTRYRLEHNTTFREAKYAVHAKRQANKETAEGGKPASRITTSSVPSLNAQEYPPLKNLENKIDDPGAVATTTTAALREARKPSFWEKQNIKDITSHAPSDSRTSAPNQAGETGTTSFFKTIIPLVFTALRQILKTIPPASTFHHAIEAILSLESFIARVL
ncbi:uncharacterized protein LOC120843213 [Ixodes scapularis]|uniref:uncharacterized protein LOC120843213 n=1 Tax=Ixodes scapularis TaxID=6945 RepID=UPI001A9FD934|nr:uncharacterized protein LOC120843213 [Ixodes scapularis]